MSEIPICYDHADSMHTELLCPVCGGPYLHQDSIEVFFRDEDASDGIHIGVGRHWLSADVGNGNMENPENPSKRRDGLFILFWCEQCSNWEGVETEKAQAKPLPMSELLRLNIYQHKGWTTLGWDEDSVKRLRLRHRIDGHRR